MTMPTPDEILQTLAATAHAQAALAILWHILLAALIVALLLGWRPTQKMGAMALAVPLLSVSLLAWFYGNPFNGTVFLLSAAGLAAIGSRRPGARVEPAPVWASVIGVIMVGFGWVYPHFLEGAAWTEYLYRAPTGLIPCPTLSLAIGLALLANGFSSRAYSVTLGTLGIFYSLFGAFRLGVVIDIALLAGAVALLALSRSLHPFPRT
jgi:hypothetical protein